MEKPLHRFTQLFPVFIAEHYSFGKTMSEFFVRAEKDSNLITIIMILKTQNSTYDNSDSILTDSFKSPYLKNSSNYSNERNPELSYQLEETLNYLLQEYQDMIRHGGSSDYRNVLAQYNFHTRKIEKRGIPEIHMKKQSSNTKLRTCNDMSGILGKMVSDLYLSMINI